MNTFSDKEFNQKGALMPFLKRIFQYAMRQKRWVYAFGFWVIMVAVADAAFPIALKMMLDDALIPELENIKNAMEQGIPYTADYSGVYCYVGLFALISLLQVVGVYFFILYTGRVQEYVLYDLRKEMFEKLQKLSFSYYDKSASGWLLTRLTSDTDRVAEVIAWGLLDFLWGCAMIVFCTGALFYFSWKLALIVLISIPIMLVVSVKIRMLVLQYSREARKLNSDITASYSEHINGISVIKSTAKEAQVTTGFKALSGRMRKSSYKASYFTAMYFPVVIFIGTATAAFVVFYGSQMAIALPPLITVGVLAASFDYTLKIFFPIVDISMFYARAQGSLSAGERIFSLLDEKIDIFDTEGVTDFESIKGQVQFDNVEFYYKKGHPVLPNFNLTIEAGQSIALVGATGEGKSTITNLVSRFYEPVGGRVLIDGEDYKTKSLKSLRSQLGIVLQTPHLFSGTIADNIRYSKREATMEEIHKALNLVGAEEFIPRLEEEVGEDGDNLSMGEKQLVSFARAVLADPRIFIMDEATSSIDTLTEAKIQKGIEAMLQGRTAIIIAHRLSTIKNCDRILVIQKGEIAEDGSHYELMKQKGKYYQLYTKQLRTEKLGNLVLG